MCVECAGLGRTTAVFDDLLTLLVVFSHLLVDVFKVPQVYHFGTSRHLHKQAAQGGHTTQASTICEYTTSATAQSHIEDRHD